MKFLLAMTVSLFPLIAYPADIADPQHGVKYTQERVEPPADHVKWYLTVMGDAENDQYHRLRQWFASHEGLKVIRDATHYNEYASSTQMFRERYARSTKTLPCVRIQRHDGKLLHEWSGAEVPRTPDQLYVECFRCLRRHQYHYHYYATPKPEPKPEPKPGPKPDLPSQPIVKPVEPLSSEPPLWIMLALASAGGIVGAGYQWRQTQHHSRG